MNLIDLLISFCGFVIFFIFGQAFSRLRLARIIRPFRAKSALGSRAQNRLNNFVQACPFPTILFSPRGRVEAFSDSFTRLFDFQSDWMSRKPKLSEIQKRIEQGGQLGILAPAFKWIKDNQAAKKDALPLQYIELIHLRDGRKFRLIGWKDTDRKVRLQFIDVSDDVRKETDLLNEISGLYNAIRSMRQGVAIFDRGGALSYVNPALDEIWNTDFDVNVGAVSFAEFSQLLKLKSKNTSFWDDLQRFVSDTTEATCWQAELTKTDGNSVQARICPLPQGALMCEFWPN